MSATSVSRRRFLGAAFCAPLLGAARGSDWISLFDGHSLDGWNPSENKGSWKISGNTLAADGPRSHLFYNGPVHGADFKNFELEVELTTKVDCNSGIYFHTAYQETGFPDKGFEIQVNNTASGEGGYSERKRTASLYGLRNMYKQLAADDKPFKIYAAVRGKNVQIRLNGQLVVDYVEPTPPVIPESAEKQRFLDHGTFALQCHNNGSRAFYHSVRVRPLADDLPAYTSEHPSPVVDDTFRRIINIGRHNLPMVDYHVALTPEMNLDRALRKSMADGIQYGLVTPAETIRRDTDAAQPIESRQGKPVFSGLSAPRPGWTKAMPREAAARFDYVLAEAAGQDAISRLDSEPIDILSLTAAPPDDPGAAKALVDALVRNRVALELNTRGRWPNETFIRAARDADCKFAFGTGNTSFAQLQRCEYGLDMVEACQLTWKNFFVPGAWYPTAVSRRWA